MTVESPFTITVYDKTFAKRGTVGNPESLTVTPRHNQQPSAQMIVSARHPRLADLMEPGARVWIRYHGDHLMSGPARLRESTGTTDTATFTFQITDDWFLFSRLLLWANPGSAIDAQTVHEQDIRTGPAESVIKGYVSANAGRSTPPLTVGSDLGRGDTVTIANRFKPVTDLVIPAIDRVGIGTQVVQAGAGLLFDVYETRTYPRTLSEGSGNVVEWHVSQADMDATQVIVGGKGEGIDRAFTRVTDPTLEAVYGYSVEVFKDDTASDTDDERIATGLDTLAEKAPTAGISVTLAETPAFRYDPTGANGFRVGDIVTIVVGPNLTVTDILRQVTLSWSNDNGFRVTPQIGERSNDPNRLLVKAVRDLARGFRNLTGR